MAVEMDKILGKDWTAVYKRSAIAPELTFHQWARATALDIDNSDNSSLTVRDIFKLEAMATAKLYTFCVLWAFPALCLVTGCHVQSVFPDMGQYESRHFCNTIFKNPKNTQNKTMTIMWSSMRDLSDTPGGVEY